MNHPTAVKILLFTQSWRNISDTMEALARKQHKQHKEHNYGKAQKSTTGQEATPSETCGVGNRLAEHF